ncbi:hypothetical protein CRENPOLYSF2_670007 [Crenothrix polyspora]|uniref:Uncharacterized protein n=1 Tax=Crenothrix polyspora TaxID=360316 RepID=A0A1R4HHD5_9GAMM|nr:hypothetical protein CRENPOLYSF2_670007 [Crenothrix polyspora]
MIRINLFFNLYSVGLLQIVALSCFNYYGNMNIILHLFPRLKLIVANATPDQQKERENINIDYMDDS